MTYNYRRDPVLSPILDYWIQKRGPRAMPRKRDIDPVEIQPKLLPNLQIIDVIGGGARFRYRLVGSASVDAYGTDYTGSYPDELFADDRLTFLLTLYRTVCEAKTPLFSFNRYHTTRDVDVFATRIYMPLSEDDRRVDHILGILRFESGAAAGSGPRGKVSRLDPSGQCIETIRIDAPGAA